LSDSEKTVTSGHGRKIKGLYRDMTMTRCDRALTRLGVGADQAIRPPSLART
jgi:hypothetical protein